MSWPQHPTDYYGKLTILDRTDEASQGNVVVDQHGVEVGVYLDDSMPRLDYWVKQAILHMIPNLKIWVSIPMARWHLRYGEPTIPLLEWYTFQSGISQFELPEKMPKCRGYILQDKYPGYLYDDAPHIRSTLKTPPPKVLENLVHEALENHPEYIFRF